MNRHRRSVFVVVNVFALLLGGYLIAGCAASGQTTSPDTPTLTAETADAMIQVSGMSCPQCAHGIVLLMDDYDEIQSKRVDLGRGVVLVGFAPGKSLTADQLQKLIRDAGFTPGDVSFPGKAARS